MLRLAPVRSHSTELSCLQPVLTFSSALWLAVVDSRCLAIDMDAGSSSFVLSTRLAGVLLLLLQLLQGSEPLSTLVHTPTTRKDVRCTLMIVVVLT